MAVLRASQRLALALHADLRRRTFTVHIAGDGGAFTLFTGRQRGHKT